MKISFWEKTFENDDTFLFGAAPNKTITEFEQVFDKNWSVLDVGCGDGKNAIYQNNEMGRYRRGSTP